MYSFSSQQCKVGLFPKPSGKERFQVAVAAEQGILWLGVRELTVVANQPW